MVKKTNKLSNNHIPQVPDRDYETSLSELADAHSETSVQQAKKIIESLSNTPVLSESQRVEALKYIKSLSADALERVTPRPVAPPYLFKNRSDDERDFLPSQFVMKHFFQAYYCGTLDLSHIRGFDPYLYESLLRERRQNNGSWTGDFHVPTKKEALDAELSSMTEKEISRIKALAFNLETRRREKAG